MIFIALAAVPVRGDEPTKAELRAFKKCVACHAVGEAAKNKRGPHLNDLFGRPAGSIEGFRYSKAMTQRGGEGLVWNDETLAAYLSNPREYVSGTKMSFVGLRRPTDMEAILHYLKRFSAGVPKKTD